jgi:hypothetical protein
MKAKIHWKKVIITSFGLFIFTYIALLVFKPPYPFHKKKQKITVTNAQQVASPDISPTLIPSQNIQGIDAPVNDFYVQPKIIKQKDDYKLTLEMRTKEGFIMNMEEVNNLKDKQSSFFWQETISNKYQQYLQDIRLNRQGRYDINAHEDAFSWSPDGRQFAVYLPTNKLVVFTFDFQKKETLDEQFQHTSYVVKIKDKKEYQLKSELTDVAYVRLFFSGDNSELYVYAQDSNADKRLHYVIDLATDINTAISFGTNTYYELNPIPNSKGYTYLTSKSLNLVVGENKQVYPLHGEVDSIGKIELSPNKDKVCFEHGASGYWGYSIYSLNPVTVLKTGQQYSYCSKWIDNEHVVIHERPYYGEGYVYTYVFNTSTKEKLLIEKKKMN